MNCTRENCTQKATINKRCQKHYYQDYELTRTRKYGPCAVEGCTNRANGQLCSTHYAKERELRMPPCSAQPCDKKAVTKTLCHKHYQKARRDGVL